MSVKNLPNVVTQWNSGTTRESNPGPRVRIPSALTTKPLSHTFLTYIKRTATTQRKRKTREHLKKKFGEIGCGKQVSNTAHDDNKKPRCH